MTTALEVGYRHIDTAQMYQNEEGVGAAIASSGIARDDLYVTSKLNNGFHRPDDARRAFDETLGRLGLDRIDLFLIHWPLPTVYDGDFVSTWRTLAEFVEDGRATSIGVSNFQPAHLDRIVAETGVVPAVNQIEVHPYFTNEDARAASIRHGAEVEAWSPIAKGKVVDDEVIGKIAAAHGKTPSQVTLRWHVERGDIVFPKSMREERMRENFEIFDFTLTADEVAAISALDQGEAGRTGPNPDTFDYVQWRPRSGPGRRIFAPIVATTRRILLRRWARRRRDRPPGSWARRADSAPSGVAPMSSSVEGSPASVVERVVRAIVARSISSRAATSRCSLAMCAEKARSITSTPASVSATTRPRPSPSLTRRVTQPCSTQRSTRLVTAPEDTIVQAARSLGVMAYGAPSRRRVARTSNSPSPSPCSAYTATSSSVSFAASRCRRPMIPWGETSRSGRCSRHFAMIRPT